MHSQLGQHVPLCCSIQQLYDTLVMGLVKETFECRDGTLAVMTVTGEATLTLEQDSYSRPLAFGTGILSMGADQSRFSDRRLNLPS